MRVEQIHVHVPQNTIQQSAQQRQIRDKGDYSKLNSNKELV